MTDAIRAQAAPGQPPPELAPLAARTWNPGDRAIAALFLLPTALLIAAVFVFPLGWSVYLSFTRYSAFQPSVPPVWVGLDNYARLLSSDAVWTACITTGRYVFLAVGLEFLLGFGIALMLNRAFPGRGLLRRPHRGTWAPPTARPGR
jgi:multiple sugar transport system permease protein